MNARQRRACRRLQLSLLGRMVKFCLPGCEGLRIRHREGRVSYLPSRINAGPVWWVGVSMQDEDGYPMSLQVPMRNLRARER